MSKKQQIERKKLAADVLRRLQNAPVVSVLGARQVGKTTLSRQVEAQWSGPVTRFDLELPADRETLSQSAHTVFDPYEGLVILDEVQRLPELFTVLHPRRDLLQGRTSKRLGNKTYSQSHYPRIFRLIRNFCYFYDCAA